MILYFVWGAGSEGNTLLNAIQYQYDSLDIARHLIQNKLTNQRALLKTIRKKSAQVTEAITLIQDKLAMVSSTTTWPSCAPACARGR